MANPPYFTDRVDLVTVQEHEDDYYLALGRFVHTFSGVELALKALLASLAGLPSRDDANAVFSGVRVQQAMSNIKRLHEARSTTSDPAYSSVTDQLAQILSARDSIVHLGAKFADGKPTEVSNSPTAHTRDKIRTFPISAKLLNSMVVDLEEIKMRIHAALWRPGVNAKTHKLMFGDLPSPTWQYTHAPQPAQQDKKAPNTQTRKPPPQSSRA